MKKVFLSIAIASMLFGADVVIKTAGATADDNGLSVQNSDSTEVFVVESNGTVVAPQGRISDKTGFVSPVGSVVMFASATAPQGWLTCDGSAVSRTDYADLYAVIGDTYGAGDGSTTFNLPDMSGKGAIGYKSDNTKFDAMGKTGGEEIHTLTKAEMPNHTHNVDPVPITIFGGSHSHTVTVYRSNGANDKTNFGRSTDGDKYNAKSISGGSHTHSVNIPNTTSTSAGSSTAHNVLDPYLVMNFIIKY